MFPQPTHAAKPAGSVIGFVRFRPSEFGRTRTNVGAVEPSGDAAAVVQIRKIRPRVMQVAFRVFIFLIDKCTAHYFCRSRDFCTRSFDSLTPSRAYGGRNCTGDRLSYGIEACHSQIYAALRMSAARIGRRLVCTLSAASVESVKSKFTMN